MSTFTNKQIKRSIRDLTMTISTLRNAGNSVYQARVEELINLISSNPVLTTIIGPYLDMKVNFKEIENQRTPDDWIRLKLPADKDLKTAYILQVMKKSAEGQFDIVDYAFQIFIHKRFNDNLSDWNQQLLFPALDYLQVKISDLIEDEIDGKDKISSSSLQINNYGTISASHSNVAIGQGITQTVSTESITDEILSKAIANKIINVEQKADVKKITENVINELNQKEPSKDKLISFANNLYQFGKKGLVSLTMNVLHNPVWSDAITAYLLTLIP